MKTSIIKPAEFIQLQQSATVVDLRTPAEVASESLDGCVCLPLQVLDQDQLQTELSKKEGREDSQDAVYLLCQSGARAQAALEKLNGFKRPLVVIEGGLNALKAHNITVTKGESNMISLERQVRIAAGAFTVMGVALGFLVNPNFYALSAFVGLGLMFAGITNTCGMGLLLARMPWNQR